MDISADSRLEIGAADFPTRGLAEVLTGWSGAGGIVSDQHLLEVLANVGGLGEREWESTMLVRRARRVLWQRIAGAVSRLPGSGREWIEALPATSESERLLSPRPLRPVHWPRTVVANRGWPPPGGWEHVLFSGRRRDRVRDEILSVTLAWVTAELLPVKGDAYALLGLRVRDDPMEARMQALTSTVETIQAQAREPSQEDVAAVARAGHPWNLLAPLADELLSLRSNPMLFAYEILLPDDELRARLFHLAAFGQALASLLDAGSELSSRNLLGGASSTPQYVAVLDDARNLECWFEAAGCWRAYGGRAHRTAYQRATAAVRGYRGALSPDCLFVVSEGGTPTKALVFECKYSLDPGYVARDGYLQALAYAAELAALLAVSVTSFVVGPVASVGARTQVDAYDVSVGPRSTRLVLGTCNIPQIPELLGEWLATSA